MAAPAAGRISLSGKSNTPQHKQQPGSSGGLGQQQERRCRRRRRRRRSQYQRAGLGTPPVDTTSEVRVVGTTKIIADKNANAIIVIGGEDAKAKVFRLLDQLDQRIPQVMLHCTVGELTLDDKHQFGGPITSCGAAGLGVSPGACLNTVGSSTAATNTGTSGIATTGTTGTSTVSTSMLRGRSPTTSGTGTTGTRHGAERVGQASRIWSASMEIRNPPSNLGNLLGGGVRSMP